MSGPRDISLLSAAAFLLALASGPLLLVVVLSRALLTGFHERLFRFQLWQGLEVHLLQLLVSWFSVGLACALVFRYVPDTRVAWKNALVGAAMTSLAFNAGNSLVGLYLGRASVTAAYGAAGSLVVVLLWLYFSAQFLLLGAEFTRAYAQRFGAALSPRELEELDLVRQLLADATGKQLMATQAEEPVLLGAAILGSVAAGAFPNVGSAMAAMSATDRNYQPAGGATAALHAKRYDAFTRLQALARDIR